MLNLLKQRAYTLRLQLEASKGGNVPGVTEDHRYEMLRYLVALEAAIAKAS